MIPLNGKPLPVPIAPGGYSLEAPGLRGSVTEVPGSSAAMRSEGGPLEPALQAAAQRADVVSLKTFAIDVVGVDTGPGGSITRAAQPLQTADGRPAIVLRVPVLQADAEQAVLLTDESGVTQWIFPTAALPTTQGKAEREFLLPRDAAPSDELDAKEVTTRGRLTKLGRRLVRVLAWLTEDIVGMGANYVAHQWESKRRAYGWTQLPSENDRPVMWDSLRGGRALLLIHGTFSTANAAFGQIPATVIDALSKVYGDRIFAFDHPTLHASPQDNIEKFFEMLPAGTELNVDIVTHSRGGLVGRELIERSSKLHSQGRKVNVRKAIFVAAPMCGTILTDTRHGIQLLDRYTNLFTELPDGAFTISMEAIYMLAKLLYHGAVTNLPGLRSMYPPGDYLRALNQSNQHSSQYYAITADFKPRGTTLLSRFGWAVANAAVDGIFGEANDGVVPTRGSYQLASTINGFPISPEHRFVFPNEANVHHCNYFTSPTTHEKLVQWLGDD